MNAKEAYAEIQKKFDKGEIDRKLYQVNEACKLLKNDQEFIGTNVISHYFVDDAFTYATTHFTSDKYEWLLVEVPKDNPDYSHHQFTFEDCKDIR